ncbi:MAG: thermonuclease family protein [Elusimicrobia bacterium]|nr:thermonuclease family protein [Elusimicrobiota bacterium]
MYRNLLVGFLILAYSVVVFAQETAKVLKVVDGQSLEIEYDGQKETIYFLGVAIPKLGPGDEIYKSKKYKKTLKKREKESFKLVKSLVREGDRILIEFDERKWDRLHRFVGYIFVSDGRMLNEEVIKAGYSNVELRPPNIKYEDRFNQIVKEAKIKKKGIWK